MPARRCRAYGAKARRGLLADRFLQGQVAQQLQHALGALCVGEDGVDQCAVGPAVDEHVLGLGDEAVLDAAEAAQGVLVGAGVEVADVLPLVLAVLGEVDGVDVLLAVVVIVAVAGHAAEEHALVLVVPVVDGQHDEALADGPGVGERGHEAPIDHVPALLLVLLLLVHDAEEGGAAVAHGEAAELAEDVGLLHLVLLAHVLDAPHDLADHVVGVEAEVEAVLDGQAAADVKGVQRAAELPQVAIDVHALAELIPVVGGVGDAGVDEEVHQLQAELLLLADVPHVEGDDVLVPDPQAAGVELELGRLLGGDADADVAGALDHLVQRVDLAHVVDDGHHLVAAVGQAADALDVALILEAVAQDGAVLGDAAALDEQLDHLQVVGAAGLQVHALVQHLVDDVAEVVALGAVEVLVASLIIVRVEGLGEAGAGHLDLLADLGQVADPQGRAVLPQQVHERQVVPDQVVAVELELILREVEGLLDEVDVAGLHCSGSRGGRLGQEQEWHGPPPLAMGMRDGEGRGARGTGPEHGEGLGGHQRKGNAAQSNTAWASQLGRGARANPQVVLIAGVKVETGNDRRVRILPPRLATRTPLVGNPVSARHHGQRNRGIAPMKGNPHGVPSCSK